MVFGVVDADGVQWGGWDDELRHAEQRRAWLDRNRGPKPFVVVTKPQPVPRAHGSTTTLLSTGSSTASIR